MPTLTRREYEDAVLSSGGPASSTVKLVLMAISNHCRRPGSIECWPSIRRLMGMTGLHEHAVIDSIKKAVDGGYLDKREGQVGDMERRGSVYTLRLPTTPTVARGATLEDRRPLHEAQRSDPPTVALDPPRPLRQAQPKLRRKKEKLLKLEGGEPHLGTKREGNGNGHGNPARQETLNTWAEAHGITRSDRETDDAYQRRCIDAWAKAHAQRGP